MNYQGSQQIFVGQAKKQYLRCPYVRKHKVEPRKFMNHILKCKKSLSKKYLQRFTTCKYNSLHIFTIFEIGAHQLSCPNRSKIEKLQHQLLQQPRVLMEEISQFSSHPSIAIPQNDFIPTEDDINYVSVHSGKSSKSRNRKKGKKTQNNQQRVEKRVGHVVNDIYNNTIGLREEQNDFDKYFNINYYQQNWFDQVQNQLANMRKVNQSINTCSLGSKNSQLQQKSQCFKQQYNDTQYYVDQSDSSNEQTVSAYYNLTLSQQSQQQNPLQQQQEQEQEQQQQQQEIIVHQQPDSPQQLSQSSQLPFSCTQITQCTSEQSYHDRSITSNKTLIHNQTKKGILFRNNKKEFQQSDQNQFSYQHKRISLFQQPQQQEDKRILQKKRNQKYFLSLIHDGDQGYRKEQQTKMTKMSNQQNIQNINNISIVNLKVNKKKVVEMSCRTWKKNDKQIFFNDKSSNKAKIKRNRHKEELRHKKQQALSKQSQRNQDKQLAQCQQCKKLLCNNNIRLWRNKKIIKLLKAYNKLQEQHQLIKQRLRISNQNSRSIQKQNNIDLEKSHQIVIVSDDSSNSKFTNSRVIQSTIINKNTNIQRNENINQLQTTKEASLSNFTNEQNKTKVNLIIQV